MIKAIIFDVDGVLVDSRNANIALYQTVLQKAGYPVASPEKILECFHLPLRQTIIKLTGSTDLNEIKRTINIAKDPALRDRDLFEFPDKLEYILEKLHKDYRLSIVTGRIKIGVEDVFSAKEIKHLFDVVVTFEDYKNPKPHPEPLLVALNRLGLSPDEAIYIGDSETDIEAAKAAGMKSIFISSTKHKYASDNIAQFNELPKAIERLSNVEK